MNTCPKCGAVMQDSETVCRVCGAPAAADAEQYSAANPRQQNTQPNPWQQSDQSNPWQQNAQQNPWQQNAQSNPWQQDAQQNPWQQNTQQNPWQQDAQQNPWQQNAQQNPWQQDAQQNPWQQNAQQNPWQQDAQQNPWQQDARQNPWQQDAQQNPWQQNAQSNPWQQNAQSNPWQQDAQSNPWQQDAQQNPWQQDAQSNPWQQNTQQNPWQQNAQQDPWQQDAQSNPWQQNAQQDYRQQYAPADGTPVQESGSKFGKLKKKFGGKKITAAAIAAAVVIIGVCALTVVNRPTVKIGRSIMHTLKDWENNFCGGLLSLATDGGSVSLSADLQDFGFTYDEAAVNGTVYFDPGSMNAAAEVSLSAADGSEIGASVYADRNNVAVQVPLLSDSAFGISLKNAGEQLQNSVFNPDSGSDYALGSYVYDAIEQALQSENSLDTDTAMKIVNKYATAAVRSALRHASIRRSSEQVPVGSKDIGTTAYDVTLDGNQLVAVLNDLYDKVRNDSDLKDILITVFDYGIASGTIYGYDDGRDAYNAFIDSMDEALDELDEYYDDELEDICFETVFYIAKSGNSLVALETSFNTGYEYDNFRAELTLGKNLASTEELRLSVEIYDNDFFDLRVKIKDNSSSQFSADVAGGTYGDTDFSCAFNWDKKSGSFTLRNKENDSVISGTMTQSGGSTVIALESYDNGYEEIDIPATLTINTKASVPSVPDYVNILEISESDMDNLIDEIEDFTLDMSDDMELVLYDIEDMF